MRIFYFEKPLARNDLEFVVDEFELESEPEQVQIPYVLPVLGEGPLDSGAHNRHLELLRGHVRRAGISRDSGQVIFVAPSQLYWNATIVCAIYEESGYLPYMVQTAEQLSAIGNTGPTRILDTHGISGLKS